MNKRRGARRKSDPSEQPGAASAPAKSLAGADSGRRVPRRSFRRLESPWAILLVCVLSPVLLLLSFAPTDQWLLAYVALAPWAVAMLRASRRWAVIGSVLAGLVFWGLGLYWLTWVTLLGYAASVAYLQVYWLLAAVVLRAAHRRNWPLWLVLPVAWVALEYAREFVISGFTWFQLAHSQHTLIPLIQISDLTGPHGLSFFVAMVNGLIVDVAIWRLERKDPSPTPTGAPAAAAGRAGVRRFVLAGGVIVVYAAFLLGYGFYRLGQNTQQPGPRVGLVQQAYPISLYYPYAGSDEIFDAHIKATQGLQGQGCDLIVWPETMLPASNMDPDYWMPLDADRKDSTGAGGYFYSEEVRDLIKEYQGALRRLSDLIAQVDCPLLLGGMMPARGMDHRQELRENAALFFERSGPRGLELRDWYGKMHLVPFSEYVPYRASWPWLFDLLRQCVPEAMSQLEPGRRPVKFRVRHDGHDFSFATPICYEGTFGRVCRKLVNSSGEKCVDLLVNISNDGWFVYQDGAGTYPSDELDQHLAQYQFRAVENRIPVVRAVNCGISAYVDSNGRVQQVLQQDGRRRMVCGTMVAQVLVDSRISLYSLAGDWWAQVDSLVAVVGVAVLLWRRHRRSKDGHA